MVAQSLKTIIIIMLSIFLLSLGACRSGKKTAKKELGRIIEMPCDESKYSSDDEFIRASQIARSSDLTVAREKAFLVTQERLTSLVENSVRTASRRYFNEKNINQDFDFGETTESMVIMSASLTVQMVGIACEKTFINDSGIYTTSMSLEIGRQQLLDVIQNAENTQRYFKLKEDRERFKEIFNEETLRPFQQ